MIINKIDNTNFKAGNVYLKRIDSQKSIQCYDAIKKLAEDKSMDIFITKSKETKYLPREDMYVVIAKKEIPVVSRMFFSMEKISRHGTGCAILSKKANEKELSTKIYNATMNAIDTLEKKLAKET